MSNIEKGSSLVKQNLEQEEWDNLDSVIKSQLIIDILSKSSNERTQNELKVIMYYTKHLQFFEE